MAGFKETPRQKMIGMMYLVLTAMLALNVSKEILQAFVIVNDSVEKTSQNFTKKVNDLHNEFDMQNSLNPDKVGEFYDKAVIAKNYSNELVNFMDSLKYALIAYTDGIPFDTAKVTSLEDIKAKDNYSKPTHVMVGVEGSKNAQGYVLEKKIDQYREDMLSLIDESDRDSFKMGLKTEGGQTRTGGKLSWVDYNFFHTILAADVTILNKLINEVRNTEYDVVSYLMQGITKDDFKISKISARVLPESKMVFQGEPFNAEIFIAAVDEDSKPRVDYVMGETEWSDNFANNATPLVGDSGIVRMPLETGNMEPGEYTFAGRIGIKKPNSDQYAYHPFSSSFYVLEPSANVAATKMNVFYRGVDNPVKISAAGVPASEVQYEIQGDGRIQTKDDELVVNNLQQKRVETVKVIVYRETEEGRKQLGEQEFRVKDLPDPIVFVRGMDASNMVAKQSFLVNPYLLCALPDYVNFEYDFRVTSFTMLITKGGDSFPLRSNSPQLTPEMKDYIQNARRGQPIVFTDIKVQGPIRKRDVGAKVIKLN